MKIYDKTDRLILDIVVNDNSYRNRAIMGDHNLTLYYSLPTHVEIPVGSYCEYEGTRYFLLRPEQLKMKHTRLYDYTVTFSSEQDKAKIWKFRNPVDGRLKFPLTAKPKEHLQMFVDNMNRRDSGWTVGECIDDVETLISYDHDYCWDALTKQATTFKTEFEIVGKRVSLRKVEYSKSQPLPLSYGRGNGFKSGVGRSNSGDSLPTEILFVQGGDRNIDRSKYPASETLRATSGGCLLLPVGQTIGYDGEHFENEDGYNPDAARHYIVDDLGLSIRNIDKELSTLAEDSLDRSDDYPKRVGTISQVVEVDKDKNFYDFIDSSIPADLNYEDYLIGEEQMTVVFQSGELAGREFDVKYYHEPKTINGKNKTGRRFEIVAQEIDGMMMPGGSFVPKPGDTYAVFNVMLPDAYIRNDADKSGASWDMFRAAVKHLFDNEQMKFSFTGELDGIWAKKDWINIGGRIRLGGFVRFTNEQFEREGVLVRITNIKDYINNPHKPKITLSNETVSGSVSSTLKELQSTEVVIDENHRAALQFTKRRFRDAKETIEMIEAALSDNFTNRINPIAVETMSLLVGDERLQYQFVAQPGSTEAVPHNIEWSEETKQLVAPAGTIQHLTLGIDSIRPSHEPNEYLYWNVASFESASLTDGAVKYYLYIRAVKQFSGVAGSAEFRLETVAHKLEEGNYYWLLVGVLNTEYDGERSFATLYGFTEILPGRITADRLLASDGQSYFDMLNAAMKLKDKLQFNIDGDGELKFKGVMVQSQNGIDESPLGCYRGEYNAQTTYFNGDEVVYRPDEQSPTSSYRCISPTPITGVPPTNTLSWQVSAAGVAGEPGKDGKSPVLVFCGKYDSKKTYYGNEHRLDAVKYGDTFYIARIDAGTFYDVAPDNTSKWNSFGASFESIATNLLLAEGANIGDWFIKAGQIVSTLDDTAANRILLQVGRYVGSTFIYEPKIILETDTSSGDHIMPGESSRGAVVTLDATSGLVETRSKQNYDVSYMSPSGIFANRAGTEAMSATTGRTFRASLVGLGFANVDKSEWAIDKLSTLVMGVYGSAQNSGTAMAVGGFFDKLYAHGLILHRRAISGTKQTVYLGYNDTMVVGYTSDEATVYLPLNPYEGQVIFVKQWWSGWMRFKPRSGHHIYDDSTENDYYDFSEGQGGMFVFSIGYVTSGNTTTKKESWLVSRWKY